MDVQILLFGPMASSAGSDQMRVRVDSDLPTCGELREAVVRQYPEVAELLPMHRFAVNTRFVADDRQVEPGDEVALIGMVSGG